MLQKLALKLGLSYLGRLARSIAEGGQGPTAQKWYIALIGKKRMIGFVLGCLVAAMIALGEPTAVDFVVGSLAAVFISLGLLDKDWRDAPWPDTKWLVFLRSHAMDVSAILAFVAAAFSECSARLASIMATVHLTCENGTVVMVVVAAVLAHLGIQAQVKAAEPPILK